MSSFLFNFCPNVDRQFIEVRLTNAGTEDEQTVTIRTAFDGGSQTLMVAHILPAVMISAECGADK